jgi:hypothetical protein
MSSVRNVALFNPDGTGTPFLRAQWQAKTAAEPFMARNPLVGKDGRATAYFAAVWRSAFPGRDPLPKERLADDAGKGTTEFWDVFG